MKNKKIAVLGAGLAGCCAALEAARLGYEVSLFDKQSIPINGASLHNEGKLHLGYVYGADPKAETHEVMIKGSLSFFGLIESLTGINCETYNKSAPFIYAIPNDSQLSVEQQLNHFQSVDETIEKLFKQDNLYRRSPDLGQSKQLNVANFVKAFNSKTLQAAIQTDEYSVNTRQIANIVSAAIMSNPMIHFYPNSYIESGGRSGDGYKVQLKSANEQTDSIEYNGVINCLWEDRIRVDRTNDIQPPRPWLIRYKAAICGHIEKPIFPSATLITGAYGDLVNHNDGQFYLSWYPKCKLGESYDDNFPEIEKNISSLNSKRLVKESIDAMSQFIPQARTLLKAKDVTVGGGYIFAWGKSDIVDPKSQLHQRHLIGATVHDRWVSVDTGKYCTAPMYGVEAAQLLSKQLD